MTWPDAFALVGLGLAAVWGIVSIVRAMAESDAVLFGSPRRDYMEWETTETTAPAEPRDAEAGEASKEDR